MSDDIPRGLSEKLILFRVVHRVTGELLTVDQRTFDPALHDALDPIPEEAGHYVARRSSPST